MIGAGGLFAESITETAAAETAATTGATAAGTSMFSSLMPYVGLAYMAYSFFSNWNASKKQKEYQRSLAEQQIQQTNILREKIKRDNAGLYSSVQSSIAQTNAAMGAVY